MNETAVDGKKLIFTQLNKPELKDTAFIYDIASKQTRKIKCRTTFSFDVDFQKEYTIQVGTDIFGFAHNKKPAEWVRYYFTGLESESVKMHITPKAIPLTPRSSPSLANYQDSYVLVIAGIDENLQKIT